MSDDLWSGFSGAVVRVDLPSGVRRLEPRPPGHAGEFPFAAPAHIITAYNPGGTELGAEENAVRHHELIDALRGHSIFDTVGSAPDGSMAEPGCGVLDLELAEAVDVGRRFGQVAIYRWTEESLSIVGVDAPTVVEMGWALVRI